MKSGSCYHLQHPPCWAQETWEEDLQMSVQLSSLPVTDLEVTCKTLLPQPYCSLHYICFIEGEVRHQESFRPLPPWISLKRTSHQKMHHIGNFLYKRSSVKKCLGTACLLYSVIPCTKGCQCQDTYAGKLLPLSWPVVKAKKGQARAFNSCMHIR